MRGACRTRAGPGKGYDKIECWGKDQSYISQVLLNTAAHTIDCLCSKILNHGLNHGLFFHFLSFLGEKTF